jgi:deoxyadenosine/deoxycytidine kinase
VIEGNIGSGKSTFLEVLRSSLSVHPVFEPHEKWQNIQGDNILARFYDAPYRWAYTFQSYAFMSRIHAIRERPKNQTAIVERSVFSDRFCFAKLLYESEMMSAMEWHMYQECFTWFVDEILEKPAGIVYLQAEPDICHERLNHRARAEESGVSREYLQRIHERHEDWLIHASGVGDDIADIPVLVLPCNADFLADDRVREHYIQKVADFITECCGIVPLQGIMPKKISKEA